MDVVFRLGEKHPNHGQDVLRVLKRIVRGIRKSYDKRVPIVVTMDSDFLDGKILTALEEELKVGYVRKCEIMVERHQNINSGIKPSRRRLKEDLKRMRNPIQAIHHRFMTSHKPSSNICQWNRPV